MTDNHTTKAGYGPELTFAHIDGLTVTGNAQPVTFGVTTSIVDCTSVSSN